MNNAIGLIETKGLLALIEATDAMAKAANVDIVKRVDIGGGLVTTVVSGDVGSVRAAVEAGASAAAQVGELLSSHIIPPHIVYRRVRLRCRRQGEFVENLECTSKNYTDTFFLTFIAHCALGFLRLLVLPQPAGGAAKFL